jgi:predicted AAA+ superfamily ATPase
MNTRQFLAGAPANNALLWGARGTGKSSLVHALLDDYFDQGLRLIEVDKTSLASLPDIALSVREAPYRFLVFCDDLSFEADDPSYKALKSALEGSIFRSSENLLIYATSNRRHLLPEYMTDNEQPAGCLSAGCTALGERAGGSDEAGSAMGGGSKSGSAALGPGPRRAQRPHRTAFRPLLGRAAGVG